MAVVEPARVARFLQVCAKWDVRAAVIGEVTDTGRLTMTWHGETVVDIPPGSAADGPVYHRPSARPAAQDALAADDPAALPRPADGAGLRADLLALIGLAGAGRQELGHRPVRPLRPRRHRAGHAGGRRPGPGGRGDRARHRAGHRRQRPLLQARPLPGHPAGAVRGVPERGRDRRAPAGRDQLPELRLAGGSRGDVAVRRGGARPGGRLRGPRRAGHRRERQLLQPDRYGRHPSHPGHRRARRARRRAAAALDRVRRGAARSSCCSAGPRPSSAGSAWAHVLHGHLGGRPPAPRPGRRAAAGRAAGRGGRRRAAGRRARPVRRRAGRRARRILPARRDRLPGPAAWGPVHRPVQRVGGPGRGGRPAGRCGGLRRPSRRARRAGRDHRPDRRRQTWSSRTASRSRWPSWPPCTPLPCPRCSADPVG